MDPILLSLHKVPCCVQVREKTVHEMRAERDADDANGLLLHLRAQVTIPDTSVAKEGATAGQARVVADLACAKPQLPAALISGFPTPRIDLGKQVPSES